MTDVLLPVWVTVTASILIAIGCTAMLIRVLRGPTLNDRVIGLDHLGYLVIGILLILAVGTGSKSVVSIALVAGLVLFLGTIAFATYLERSGKP
jgi:multicomponent Na+:H+ antiporter subunit F